MAHRKTHPHGAVSRRCEACGFVAVKLTDREWKARQPIHEMSNRHQNALKRGPFALREPGPDAAILEL
jgi:hypothetical protein